VIVGAGGIVRSAHLPAYRALRLPVLGVFDVMPRRARELARAWRIPRVYSSLADAARERGVVYDLAVPGDQVLPVLRALPPRAAVLIQKPLGRDLAEARRILVLARSRRFAAAVNFQLRFSPNMLALRDVIERGQLGEIRDVEVRVCTHTPWGLWKFMSGIPRLEILYHSIHYLDLLRSLFGEPRGVHAWAGGDPERPRYADTRSTIVLDYAHRLRCAVHTNHLHVFGPKRAASEIKVEGTKGAALARMGVNLEYPRGRPDTLELARLGGPWRSIRLRGSWFPRAFEGTMSSLQRFATGESRELPTAVADAARTMALVEACYRSAARAGTPVPAV